MAIITVSNNAQLTAAIRAAGTGDTIQLAAGNYGSIQIANNSKVLTIESQSEAAPAVFNAINVVKSANLTFEGLAFQGVVQGGYGTGTGMQISNSSNISVIDSSFADYFKALTAGSSQGIIVARNEFTRSSEDAMTFGVINGLNVLDNHVNGMKAPAEPHHDMIQITPINGPSSNVVIRGNVLDSNDLITQGIFLGNGSGAGQPHRNIIIDDNTVIGGHLHGITVLNYVNGLTITNNIVLKDAENNSFRPIDTPTINISNGSTNVQVNGNTAYKINGASPAGNTIVAETVKFSGTIVQPDEPLSPDDPDDVFRFDGDDVRGWTRVEVSNLDFTAGHVLNFVDYDADTFRGFGGDGSAALIDDVGDLRSVIADSPDVTGLDQGNTLALRIKQDAGTHAVIISGIDASDFL